MNIRRLYVTDDRFKYDKNIEEIAEILLSGDRVIIEPIGELFLIKQEGGTPQIEFIFENAFIVGVIEAQIKVLRDLQEKLGEPAKDAKADAS